MKIKLVSDLHLEFSDVDINNDQKCDTLILSGDIMLAGSLKDFPADYDYKTIVSSRQVQALRFRNFLRYCCEDFQNVIYVAGNHEFYHSKFYETLDVLRDECAVHQNLHFLEDKSVTIDNIIFVGATLWTDCNNVDPLTMYQLTKLMNDFQLIRNERAGYRKLSSEDIVKRHRKSLEFISNVAANAPKDKKIVVVGHHAPSHQSIHKVYKDDYVMNGGYSSNLDNFILDNPNIVLWTHGHVHHCFDYMIGTTRVVCNPRGYVNNDRAEMTNWDPNLVIEV